MKSAFLIAKQTYELRDIPDPVCPPDGLVLRVEACGVCGSDIRRWKEGPPDAGSYPDMHGIVAGHEVAGTIIAVGPQVTTYIIGDRLAIAPDIHCGKCYYCQRGMFNLCDTLHFLGITPGYPGGLAEKLEGEQRQMALEQALYAVLAIPNESAYATALRDLPGSFQSKHIVDILQLVMEKKHTFLLEMLAYLLLGPRGRLDINPG